MTLVNEAPRLRPMRVTDILDVTIRLYRQNFLLFAGIVALIQIPLLFLRLVLPASETPAATLEMLRRSDPSGMTASFLNIMSAFSNSSSLASLVTLLGYQIIGGALSYAIAQRYLNRPITIFGSYQLGFGRFASLIAAGVLIGIMAAVLIGVPGVGLMVLYTAMIVGAAFRGSNSTRIAPGTGPAIDPSTTISGLLCVMVGMIVIVLLVSAFLTRFVFATQTVVLEKQSPFPALGRSWTLSKGAFWRIIGLTLLVGLLLQILLWGPIGIAVLLLSPIAAKPENLLLVRIVLNTVQSLMQILLLPLQLGVPTLLYFDQRVRKEAFDLEILAQDEAGTAEVDAS